MKLSYITFAITGLMTCLGSLAAEEAVSVPVIVKSQLENSRNRAESFAKKYGYEYEFFKKTYSVKVANRNNFQEDAFIFNAKEAYNVEVLPDGRLIQFYNLYASHHGGKGQFDKPTVPTWSEEKAIEIGTEYARFILGSLPADLGKPKAIYNNRNRNAPKYLMGEWNVRWRREDKSGHKFNNLEGMDVYIYEDNGPFALFVKMYSSFEGVNFEPLKQEAVMPEAVKRAEQITQWEVVRNTFANGKLVPELAKGSLQIVQPNYFGTGNEIPTKPDLKARLAWVIWFPWVSNEDKNPNPQHPRRGIGVWIDAQNGKWLGGDSFAN